MLFRSSTGAVALAAMLMAIIGGAAAADEAKYPNWKGQWARFNPNREGQAVKYDPTKGSGLGQQAPLTPEYRKVLDESMADQAKGGLGNYPSGALHPRRDAAHHVAVSARIRHHAGNHVYPDGS